MNHTPEHTHFGRDAKFSWVLVPARTTDACPELTKALRLELNKRYAVYEQAEALPPTAKHLDEMGEYYVGGFVFTVTMKRLSKSEIAVTYSDSEAPQAGGMQTFRYRWQSGRWQVIYRGKLIVA